MRRLSDRSAMTEARRFKTLMLDRGVGGGVAMPQPTAQNQMIIANATPAWVLLAAPTAQYQVPIAGADPYTPTWAAITVVAISDLDYATPALTLSTANAEGSADTVIRTDATILIFDATVPDVIQPDDAAAAGSASVAARRDHTHGIVCAVPVATGTANAEGAATSFARADHVHLLHVHDHSGDAGDGGQLDWDNIWSDAIHDHTSDAEGGVLSLSAISDLDYAVPSLTLSTANAEGAADTVIRSDATILVFDATVPDVIQPDDAAAAGSASVAARRDHIHGIVCAAPASPSVSLAASAEGSGTSFARDDHAHQLDQAIAPTWTALHTFNAGITFGGATGVNVVTVPDDAAQAMHVVDAGGIEYLSIVSTNTQPAVVFNQNAIDVDFRVEATGVSYALFVRGSDHYIGANVANPLAPFHVHGRVLLNTGLAFNGTVPTPYIETPDNAAIALRLIDAGTLEYLRIISTNAQPVVVFNEGGADVDHRWEASGQVNALFVQGSDGFVALGHDAPERMLHIKSDTVNTANVILEEYSNTIHSPDVFQRKGRGTIASPLDVAVDDSLGAWYFSGYRNSDWRSAAAIVSTVTSLGVSVVRSKLSFLTANAAGTLVEHVVINEDGNAIFIGDVGIGTAAPTTHLEINVANTAHGGLNIFSDGAAGYDPQIKLYDADEAWYVSMDRDDQDKFKIITTLAGGLSFYIHGSGEICIPNLAGVGVRNVVVDAGGLLSAP